MGVARVCLGELLVELCLRSEVCERVLAGLLPERLELALRAVKKPAGDRAGQLEDRWRESLDVVLEVDRKEHLEPDRVRRRLF